MHRFFHTVDKVMIVDGDDVRRAPMTAELFRHYANYDPLLRLWGTKVDSAGAGVTTKSGNHPVSHAKSAMLKAGLNISSHEAAEITFESVQSSSIVLTMTKQQTEDICANLLGSYPSYWAKVIPVLDYLGIKNWNLPELFGEKQAAFAEFVQKMSSLMLPLKARLLHDTLLPLLVKGKGLGSGLANGKVRFVPTSEQAQEIEKGDVVVCQNNDVQYLLGRGVGLVAAIITESSSELMDVSQISHERHIPCVCGANHALETIESGQPVLVDGGAGAVYGCANVLLYVYGVK